MTKNEQNTATAPGITVTVGDPSLDKQQQDAATSSAAVSFEHIKRLVSSQPLRRPNRAKPVEDGE
jgi:hypothetical protein